MSSQSALAERPTITKAELSDLEKTVREGAKAFIATGTALMQIREGRGYIHRGFATFDEYTQATFGFDVRHGQRMIAAAKTTTALQEALPDRKKSDVTPSNESVARVLAPLASSDQAPKLFQRVAKELDKHDKTIATATAAEVEAVVRKVQPDSKKDDKSASKPTPKPVITGSAECPHCQTVPNTYQREGENFKCGNCNGLVAIVVVSTEAKHCPNCSHVLQKNATFCEKCGTLV